MPSASLRHWSAVRVLALDEIADAHSLVGGTSRGRRYATQQINHAYAVLLSSQFQGFCRDLHSECADQAASTVQPVILQTLVLDRFRQGRKLDSGNPNPGNIGEDFHRFGIQFWPEVSSDDRRNPARQALLAEMNQWRNAIAHQDFTRVGSPSLQLQQVRRWRAACDGLARSFDAVIYRHLQALLGVAPW